MSFKLLSRLAVATALIVLLAPRIGAHEVPNEVSVFGFVHPEGRTYRWINPDGIVTTTIPDPDDLPNLPAAWVERLNTGTAELVNRADLDTTQAATWIATLPGSSKPPCKRMGEAADGDVANLTRPGATGHDTACAAVARVIRLGSEGHQGVTTALERVHEAFVDNVTSRIRPLTSRREGGEAQREWLEILVSAVNLVSANAPDAPSCDCDGQLTALIVGQRTTSPGPAVDGTSALAEAAKAPAEVAADLDRTTWWPRQLGPVLSGEVTEDPPSILLRDDGQPLWYRGKVNGLLGESESGKTWLALEAVRQALASGGSVCYLDFEDAAPGIVSRLRAMSVPDHVIGARLVYIDPAEQLGTAAQLDLSETLNSHDFDLIVVDGFNAAMTLLGLDLISNTDATRFSQMLLKPLAKTGAAVAYVDHLPKNGKEESSGGIGAQAKRAMTTGCAIKVKVVEPFGKGMTGRLQMTVDKDRAGHVRGNSGGAKNAGTAVLESDADTGLVTVTVTAPDLTTAQQKQAGAKLLRLEELSNYLAAGDGQGQSLTSIASGLGGKNKTTVAGDLADLERRGHVVNDGTQSHQKWRSLSPFSVADDLATTPNRYTGTPPKIGVPAQNRTGGESAENARYTGPESMKDRGVPAPTGSWTTTVAGKVVQVDRTTGEVL